MNLLRRKLTVIVAAFAFALAPSVARADGDTKDTKDQKEQDARLHFNAGLNLLRDPSGARYEEAYAEFKHAYAAVPSYKILGNIALCAMKLERDAEALDAYSRYLKEATDIDEAERSQVERDVVTLKAGMATVAIESRPDGAIIRDQRTRSQGSPILNVYGPLRGPTSLGIRRGHHVFTARMADGREMTWEADIEGGETHLFEGAPAAGPVAPASSQKVEAASAERPIPSVVYVGAGLTLALAAAATITGVAAVDARSRFNEANDGTNPQEAEDLRSSGRTLNVVSDVFIVGSVVAAVATTYLYLSRPAVARGGKPSTSTGRGLPLSPGGLRLVF